MKTELTYAEAAEVLNCSPRHVRRVVLLHGITPIRRGHRTVRLDAEKIVRLQLKLVIQKARPTNGHEKRRAT